MGERGNILGLDEEANKARVEILLAFSLSSGLPFHPGKRSHNMHALSWGWECNSRLFIYTFAFAFA
jgi:hypothetical protein